jgi:hypothetical protein
MQEPMRQIVTLFSDGKTVPSTAHGAVSLRSTSLQDSFVRLPATAPRSQRPCLPFSVHLLSRRMSHSRDELEVDWNFAMPNKSFESVVQKLRTASSQGKTVHLKMSCYLIWRPSASVLPKQSFNLLHDAMKEAPVRKVTIFGLTYIAVTNIISIGFACFVRLRIRAQF